MKPLVISNQPDRGFLVANEATQELHGELQFSAASLRVSTVNSLQFHLDWAWSWVCRICSNWWLLRIKSYKWRDTGRNLRWIGCICENKKSRERESEWVRMLVGKAGVSSPRRIPLVIDLAELDMHGIMPGIRNGMFGSIVSVYQSDLHLGW